MLKTGALILFAALAAAPSIPSPSRPPNQTVGVQADQQSNGATNNQQHGSNQRQSGQHSVGKRVSADPNGERQTNATSEQGSEFWPPFYGYRIKITDSLLVLFTCGLFVVGIITARILKKTDASTAANAAAALAGANAAQANATAAAQQADIAEKQHELLRLQHLAANLPRITIGNIYIKPRDNGVPIFEKGTLIDGVLMAANRSATPAKIIESRFRMYWTKTGLPMLPPITGDTVRPLLYPEQIYKAFETDGVMFSSIELVSNPQIDPFDGWDIYIMGFIRYSDEKGEIRRFMRFCRRYLVDPGSREGSFRAINNPDYEYEV